MSIRTGRSLAGLVVGTLAVLTATALSNAVVIRTMRGRARRLAALSHDLRIAVPRSSAMGETVRIAVLGDSAARGYAIRERDQTFTHLLAHALAAASRAAVSAVCDARDGARTWQVVDEQVPLLSGHEDLVVVGIGVNDALGGTRDAELATATRRLLKACGAHAPRATVVLLTCPDLQGAPGFPWPFSLLVGVRCRRVAAVQRAVAEPLREVVVVELGRPSSHHFGLDGFHPGAAGQAAMAERVIDALRTRPVLH